MKKADGKRILIIIIFGVLAFAILLAIWFLTSQSGKVSNQESGKLVAVIINWVDKHFSISRDDYFWKFTFNSILRKFAHFMEYMALGAVICTFFNFALQKCLLSGAIALVLCPTMAYIDEYRQKFIPGRTSRVFDIGVDVVGAAIGILLTTILFAFIWKIVKLKRRIRELEEPTAK